MSAALAWALRLQRSAGMRHPYPHSPPPHPGSLIAYVAPSPEALAIVLRQAQYYARGFVVTPATRLTELAGDLAAPQGYTVLFIGQQLDDLLDYPPGQPQTLEDVARIFDAMRAMRDARHAHRVADGTPPRPVPAPPDLLAQLHAHEGARPAPPRAPAPARRRSRLSAIRPWHVLAAMFGAAGMLISFAIQDNGLFAYAFPIVSAALFSWMLTRVLPLWVPALIVGGFGLLAAFRVRDVETRWQSERDARQLDHAIAEVCNATPLGRAPNGPKLRSLHRRGDSEYWLDSSSWPAHKVPTYVLCTKHSSEEVSCGMFVDDRRPNAKPSRICNARSIAEVELRRTQTAEVVFSKRYRGDDPPPLGSYVQFGGPGSTRLGGGDVPYSTIYPDIKPFLAQP